MRPPSDRPAGNDVAGGDIAGAYPRTGTSTNRRYVVAWHHDLVGTRESTFAVAATLDAEDFAAAGLAVRDTPATELDDVLLMLATRAESGSQHATDLLVTVLEESGMVRRFVRSALLDESAVDDVCQDSLISVAGSLRSFQGSSKVSTWVHSIVRRRVVDHLRRQRAALPLPEDDQGPAQRMSSTIATRATVQEALASLPELYRVPVTMRDLHGLPYAEVAPSERHQDVTSWLHDVEKALAPPPPLSTIDAQDHPGLAGDSDLATTSPRSWGRIAAVLMALLSIGALGGGLLAREMASPVEATSTARIDI